MRIAHTMIRVSNLAQSIDFYTNALGMNLLVSKDFLDGRFTIAFVGYGGEYDGALIELTHNWDTHQYELGNGFGHIAIYVKDVYALCEQVKQKGGVVTREAGPKQYGTTIIAFIKDPDGYQIELVGAEEKQH
jgi:lactoylglutathione lyase